MNTLNTTPIIILGTNSFVSRSGREIMTISFSHPFGSNAVNAKGSNASTTFCNNPDIYAYATENIGNEVEAILGFNNGQTTIIGIL